MRYIRSGAGHEREYHKSRTAALSKERTAIEGKLEDSYGLAAGWGH